MPTLEIAEYIKGFEAITYVQAVLLYPYSADARRRFVDSARGEAMKMALKNLGGAENIKSEAMQAVIDAVLAPQFDIPNAFRNSVPGVLAGQILVFILACSQQAPELASLGVARRVVVHRLPRGKSRAWLTQMWQRFMPVAHLWAAKEAAPDVWRAANEDPAEFAAWLGFAEELRRRGEAWTPLRSRVPILNPKRTWKAPKGFAMPPVEIGLPVLPPEMLAMARAA